MIIGLDTSVILRLLTGLPVPQAAAAQAALVAAESRGDRLLVCDLVLAEAYHGLTHHYGLPRTEARAAIHAMIGSGLIETELGSEAATAFDKTGAGPVDRMIVGRYRAAGGLTLTFDGRMAKLDTVSLVLERSGDGR